MYLVRFRRRDEQPNEEYYYHHEEDASSHFRLFEEDDSGLYETIEVLQIVKNHEVTLAKLRLND